MQCTRVQLIAAPASSRRGSIRAACYRGGGYWIRCETYVCFIHGQKERADGTPMIMGYRCCSTSRSFMGMQKTLRYWPRGKIRCLTRRVVEERRGKRGEGRRIRFRVTPISLSLSLSALFDHLSTSRIPFQPWPMYLVGWIEWSNFSFCFRPFLFFFFIYFFSSPPLFLRTFWSMPNMYLQDVSKLWGVFRYENC